MSDQNRLEPEGGNVTQNEVEERLEQLEPGTILEDLDMVPLDADVLENAPPATKWLN